jgi:hypothetical protein
VSALRRSVITGLAGPPRWNPAFSLCPRFIQRMRVYRVQGWTLLNEYCPMEECDAPLVRSRRKRKFCVACSLYVVRAPLRAKHTAVSPAAMEGGCTQHHWPNNWRYAM